LKVENHKNSVHDALNGFSLLVSSAPNSSLAGALPLSTFHCLAVTKGSNGQKKGKGFRREGKEERKRWWKMKGGLIRRVGSMGLYSHLTQSCNGEECV